MKQIESVLRDAVQDGRAPGLVAMVAGRDGVLFETTLGRRTAGEAAPMTQDSVFRLFSMTKAVASVAAMRLVEEGRLDLDGPVGDLLPEFDELPLIAPAEDGELRPRRPERRAAIRHLMTHTAGPVYEMWSPEQRAHLKETGLPAMATGARDAFAAYPLRFEPGTRFGYGVSTDWLGRAVEEASGERIDALLRREIFAPLGMDATGVECSPEMSARLVGAHMLRDGAFRTAEAGPPEQPEVWCMGQALYGAAGDYIRFLRMLLNGGTLDGARVLGAESVETLLGPATPGLDIPAFASASRGASADVDFFPGTPKSHSLMALRVDADVPGMRRAGTNGWAGLMNTHYWVDPAAGICAVLMLQHLPFMEPGAAALLSAFEKAVYAEIG